MALDCLTLHVSFLYIGHYLVFSTTDKFGSLESPEVLSDGNKHCLSFYYHMSGTELGTLDVNIFDFNGGPSIQPFSKFGSQGNQWHKASATIQVPKGNLFQVGG